MVAYTDAAFAINWSPRVRGPQILIRAPGLTNLGDCVSPTTTVTLRMIYFTTTVCEIMFTPATVIILLKFRNSHKSHFQPTSTAMCPLLNDLAGLIVGVGLQHGEIQCLETG